MNIFFFGSTSFVSTELVNQLEKKFNVYKFSSKRKKTGHLHFNLNSENTGFIKKLNLKKIDYLFFFSSFVPFKEELSTWDECKNTNVYGLIRLLKNLDVKVGKVVLASSCSLYGPEKKRNREPDFLYPNTGYALTKFAQEKILQIYCIEKKINFLCYRIGYVFGSGMNKKRLVKKLLYSYKKKEKIKIFNKSLNLNLIHKNDLSNIIINTFQTAKGIYNLTDLNEITLKSFCDMLKNKRNRFRLKINHYSSHKIFKQFSYLGKIDIFEKIQRFKDEN